MVVQQRKEAREALLKVRSLAPREPTVSSLLGQVSELLLSYFKSMLTIKSTSKVCLQLGRRREALRHFDRAVLLDSKEAAALKVSCFSLPFLCSI